MRSLLVVGLTAACSLATPAFAGGEGSARLLWDKDAICQAQKRGEGPLSPNMCLDEYPAAPVVVERRRHR